VHAWSHGCRKRRRPSGAFRRLEHHQNAKRGVSAFSTAFQTLSRRLKRRSAPFSTPMLGAAGEGEASRWNIVQPCRRRRYIDGTIDGSSCVNHRWPVSAEQLGNACSLFTPRFDALLIQSGVFGRKCGANWAKVAQLPAHRPGSEPEVAILVPPYAHPFSSPATGAGAHFAV